MTSNSKKIVRKVSAQMNVEDVILGGVYRIASKNGSWKGTMTNLRKVLTNTVARQDMIPASPGALRLVLNRVVNRLRSRGVSVQFGRTTDHTRTRFVKFAR